MQRCYVPYGCNSYIIQFHNQFSYKKLNLDILEGLNIVYDLLKVKMYFFDLNWIISGISSNGDLLYAKQINKNVFLSSKNVLIFK